MSRFDEEKLTSYLDSLIDKGIPSVDCIVYQGTISRYTDI